MQIELAGAGWNSNWSELTDGEFLKTVGWKRGTQPELTQPAKKGNIDGFVAALVDLWKVSDANFKPGTRALWSLPAIIPSERETALATLFAAERLAPKKNKVVSPRSKLADSTDPLQGWWTRFQPTSLTPWEYLALLEALPDRISRLPVTTAFQIWRLLLQIACDMNQLLPLNDRKPIGSEERDRYGCEADPFLDLSLFRNCELPWLTGVVFSPVKGSEKLRQHGADLLEHELVERTDNQGAPHASLIPRWTMWLAIFTRFITLSRRHGLEPWDEDAAELYLTTVEKTAPLIHADGRLAFSRIEMDQPQVFLEEVLRTSDWSDAEAAIQTLFTFPKRNGRATKPKAGTPAPKKPLEICVAPVNQSDEAAWAVLRTHWGAHADRVTIDHDQPALNIELSIQGQRVLEGEWRSTLTIDARVIPLHGEWTCVCWQSDPEGDYIELQLTVPGVARIERQILLSRTQEFCLLGESYAEMADDEFSVSSQLPLWMGVLGTTVPLTREVQLTAGDVPIRCFPVAVPDRHVFSTPAKFGSDLSMTTTVRGTGWYNPVMLDWSSDRRKAAAEWRSLTVAEDRSAVKPGIASGYRLKVGDRQWLMYRSLLRSEEARSVLGHQTRYETVIGSVEPNGDITPLMLVE